MSLSKGTIKMNMYKPKYGYYIEKINKDKYIIHFDRYCDMDQPFLGKFNAVHEKLTITITPRQ